MPSPSVVQCHKMISTMVQNKAVRFLLTTGFWLVVWQIAAMAVGHAVLLPTPFHVIQALYRLVPTVDLWVRVGFSLFRVVEGFTLAVVVGLGMAGLAAACNWLEQLFQPVVLLAKATPVASFIILALVWMPSRNLPIFISFLMVLPVIYTSVLQGIRQTDKQLLEMAQVFQIPMVRKIKAIYLPSVFPYLYSACSVALGLAWKSGIAAEVIGLPQHSLGEALYQAKVFLVTDEMFAWTAVVIVSSLALEKFVLWVLAKAMPFDTGEASSNDGTKGNTPV